MCVYIVLYICTIYNTMYYIQYILVSTWTNKLMKLYKNPEIKLHMYKKIKELSFLASHT